jgi:hypothetical protein
MRETRLSGSEGGAAQSMRRSYPYLCRRDVALDLRFEFFEAAEFHLRAQEAV